MKLYDGSYIRHSHSKKIDTSRKLYEKLHITRIKQARIIFTSICILNISIRICITRDNVMQKELKLNLSMQFLFLKNTDYIKILIENLLLC